MVVPDNSEGVEDGVSRRRVLAVAAACGCAFAVDAVGDTGVATTSPDTRSSGAGGGEATVPSTSPAEEVKTIELGSLADYDKIGFDDRFLKQKLLVSRTVDRLVVMTAICTHKGCVLKLADDNELRCPCHKSHFNLEGVPTEGKATVPLARYAVVKGVDGRLIVDLTTEFEQEEWDKAESFIPVK